MGLDPNNSRIRRSRIRRLSPPVITSYSIHYTKLYDAVRHRGAARDREEELGGDPGGCAAEGGSAVDIPRRRRIRRRGTLSRNGEGTSQGGEAPWIGGTGCPQNPLQRCYCPPGYSPRSFARITSYNVCYTKLLRAKDRGEYPGGQ